MASATFRFYQELNDFLPAEQRRRPLRVEFVPPVPVGHLIETCGVPHTEVEIVLLNGRSVTLDQWVSDADRVSVYPMFEALDVTPLLRIREQPLRNPRFLADAHLGKLAGYLRMLGFDTLFGSSGGDRELAEVAAREKRILLSRDRALLMHRVVTHGCFVRPLKPRDQLAYLVRRLDLCRLVRPFSRCMRCNGDLRAASKSEVLAFLPPAVRGTCDEFRRCRQCRRIYWKGSHYRHMCLFIDALCANPDVVSEGGGAASIRAPDK